MVQPLQADLAGAQRNLDRLTAVREALTTPDPSTSAGDDSRRLRDARAAAGAFDAAAKQVVLEVLGVTVHVTGYDTCPTCHGTGYRPIPPGYGRHWPPSCPTCHRLRQVPRFTVQITRRQPALAPGTVGADRPAFG
jgi:hypothetical protein